MGIQPLRNLIIGTLMGAVSFLPGASGATIAVIFRVYERVVEDIADIKNKFMHDLKFVIPIGIGVLAGMILCAKGLKFLIEDYEIPMMFLFVALIVTQIPDIKRMGDDGKELTAANIVAFIIGVAIMLTFMVVGWSSDAIDANDPGIVVMFLVGIIYAMSMLSPGISGSTVLLALGLFAAYDAALADINLRMLLPMAVGLLVGALAFAKVIDHFMKNSRKTTYAVILGLTVGSALTVLINALRDLSGTETIIQSIICIFIGAALGLGLNKLAHIFAESSAKEDQSLP